MRFMLAKHHDKDYPIALMMHTAKIIHNMMHFEAPHKRTNIVPIN